MAGEICPKMKFNTPPSLLSLIDFEQLCINILGVTGEQDGITIAYLRNTSALFSMVATTREKDKFALASRKILCYNTFLSLIIRSNPVIFLISTLRKIP